jgi:threonylcarbamoyladenosine tRNA methylthiotransferase MtaB
MKIFKIYTLGCKVNQYDSLDLREKLKKEGFKNADDDKLADLVIINTCSVTKNANRKDKRMVTKAKKENPKAKVVVMGCWYKIYPETVEEIKADLFWPVGKLNDLVVEIKKLFGVGDERAKEIGGELKSEKIILPPSNGERSRYFMKVQDGCEQFCSYCVIPYSRGKLQSRDWKDIIKEVQEVERVGYREIILCGIHLGLYNQEENSQKKDKNLAWLISEIVRNTKKLRVRISSIEVNDVNDDLIQLLKDEKRFCNHLHIPLQGGEDKLLHLMNRPYDTEYFKKKIQKIRKAVPKVAITADVIVGFPSETETQFNKTCELVRDLQLSKLHVFPYSKHEKTAAAKMPGHLDNKTKQKRSRVLREISEELWQKYQEKIKSEQSEFEIIVEQIKEDVIIGKSEYYFDLRVPKNLARSSRVAIGELISNSL